MNIYIYILLIVEVYFKIIHFNSVTLYAELKCKYSTPNYSNKNKIITID
jgi:hypothetical protein